MSITVQGIMMKLFITTTFYINNEWNYQPLHMQSENNSCEVLTFLLRFKMCIEMQYETVLRPSLKKVNILSKISN